MFGNGNVLGVKNDPKNKIAKGVWGLSEQYLTKPNWPQVLQEYFSSDGSSLSGWTNSSASVSASSGNPAPSLQALGGQYAYINVGVSLLSKKIKFDVFIISGTTPLCNFFFGVNTSGTGPMLRLDTRASYPSSLTTATSWTSWTSPSSGTIYSAGVWYKIEISIDSISRVSWSINGIPVQTNVSMTLRGSVIAIHGDGSTVTGGRFDNILVADL